MYICALLNSEYLLAEIIIFFARGVTRSVLVRDDVISQSYGSIYSEGNECPLSIEVLWCYSLQINPLCRYRMSLKLFAKHTIDIILDIP